MSALEHVIPEGYKQTEVGLIPNDWFVKTFGQVMSIRHGKDQKAVQVPDGCYPIFGTGGKMGTTNTALYDKPSVLIGRKGTINKPRYIDKPFWTVDTLFYSVVSNSESAKFIYYKFCMIDWMQYNEASGVPSLNASTIESVSASFPELKEQTAIANALSDVDALISELEKLIAKKQAIKTATMQQLLTGRTRLPQFALREDGTPKGTKHSELGEIPEDWEVNCFAECGYFQSGSGFPTKYQGEQEGDYPFFKVSDMNNVGNETFLISSNNYISESVKNSISAKVIPENAIVFAKIGAAIFLERKKICFQPSCIDNNMMAYIANEDKLQFKYAYLLFKNINLGQLVEATALPSLSGRDIGQKIVALPAAEEQTAIATILSDMDAEIQALEQRLGKTRQIKQGMMQELLTGKTRLIKPSKEVIHE